MCCPGPPEKGEKGRKRARKADFGRFPGREGRHPLSPHFLHRHLRYPNYSLGGANLESYFFPIFGQRPKPTFYQVGRFLTLVPMPREKLGEASSPDCARAGACVASEGPTSNNDDSLGPARPVLLEAPHRPMQLKPGTATNN